LVGKNEKIISFCSETLDKMNVKGLRFEETNEIAYNLSITMRSQPFSLWPIFLVNFPAI
jgi:hypothetical protein